MVRYYAIFKGQVQGVGFRYLMLNYAYERNITGWVRNRLDGSVEAMLQGNNSDINDLINKLSNSFYVDIEDFSLKEMDIIEDEKGFSVKY